MSLVYLLAALAAAFVLGAYAMAALHLDSRDTSLDVARLRAEVADRDVQLRRARARQVVTRSNEKALAADVVRLTRELRDARKEQSS